MMQHHKTLTDKKWAQYSFSEQLLMIGSEFSRILHLKHEEDQKRCIERAYELIDLTLEDTRWRGRTKELLRLREVLGAEYINKIDFRKIRRYYEYCLDFSKGKNL